MAPSAIQEQTTNLVSDIKAKLAAVGTDPVKAALSAAEARYVERNPISGKQHEVAVNNLPGGNTRTLLHTSPFPLVMKQGRGPFVWDEDGHKYTDFVGELTAGIYGHSHPVIRDAIFTTFDNVGLNLGSTIIQEQKHAALMCERFGLERVRFTNSGTEANLHALNGAKQFTGKRKVVVFCGAYHGAVLSFGDGKVATNNVNKDDWVIGRYNDVESAKAVIEGTPDLAAVMVEGMQGAGGCIVGTKEFLLQIQESAKKVGAVFLLDEVMTSRLGPGGLQSILGLKPDLTSFGKYLGGGFAFGAFGGRADIMSVYDPRSSGSLAHSGTFNNNTMAMYAGYAGFSKVLTPEVNVAFNAKGDVYRQKLQAITKGTKCSFTGRGALMAIHFSDTGLEDIKSVEDVQERWDLKDLFWFEMMEDGYWITRRGSIALILDTPDEELDRFVDCVARFLERHKDIMTL
ncbi:putative glutamate-1-semialdehyde - protein [Phaeoacremonium minimum UCRPA7]|uniref:Putative glutamate-1-semialdehyde-protein n=1 Tax=Phaeoacremonium minimum (strain UCR-PA7) TaxID=1286976 RepID=R8B8N7_PHAM7|nr:putative glutamate-1-semialdehyde - protein [Phaeoacremonium minimum UCRPA7]EON95658.1 putative glutamate-1-semialdehyde - protein [Phaeoacremonium minimum UCRPA7]